MERHCQFLESVVTSRTHVVPHKSGHQHSSKSNEKILNLASFSVSKRTCPLCSKSDHAINRCFRFKEMDVSQRLENIKRFGLFLNCLSQGHHVNSCSFSFKCKSCSLCITACFIGLSLRQGLRPLLLSHQRSTST